MGLPEEVLLSLMEGGEERVTITAGILLRSIQRGRILIDQCISASTFFSKKNIRFLQEWGEDTRSPMGVRVEQTNGRITFILTQDKSRTTLDMRWPEMPEIGLMKQVAEDGILRKSPLELTSITSDRRWPS